MYCFSFVCFHYQLSFSCCIKFNSQVYYYYLLTTTCLIFDSPFPVVGHFCIGTFASNSVYDVSGPYIDCITKDYLLVLLVTSSAILPHRWLISNLKQRFIAAYRILSDTILKKPLSFIDQSGFRYISDRSWLHIKQVRFRKFFGTVDHLQTIRSLIRKPTVYNVPLHLAFFGYHKAFDSIHTWSFLAALEDGRKGSRYTISKSMYKQTIFHITIDEYTKTDRISHGKNVRQGDTILPKLFNLALKNLFKKRCPLESLEVHRAGRENG